MKRLVALGIAALLGLAAMPAQADEPLAGGGLFAVSHGQPFCTTRAALEALLEAQVAQADIAALSFPGCRLVADNALVVVGQDFVGGRYMHMVRARATLPFPFGVVEGYTFSAGLGPYPVRAAEPHVNPFF